jgi:hypothetical protein
MQCYRIKKGVYAMTQYYKMLENVHFIVNSPEESKEMTMNFWRGEAYRQIDFEEACLDVECLLKKGMCKEENFE